MSDTGLAVVWTGLTMSMTAFQIKNKTMNVGRTWRSRTLGRSCEARGFMTISLASRSTEGMLGLEGHCKGHG